MSVYFKVVFTIFFIFVGNHLHSEQDILKQHIIKYNNVDLSNYKVDSDNLFLNSKFMNLYSKKSSIQIINKRVGHNYNAIYYIAFITLLFSLIRYKSKLNLFNQIGHFFKIKIKNINEYGFLVSILIVLIFNCIVCFIISFFIYKNKYLVDNIISIQYIKKIFLLSIFMIFKFFILSIILEIFNLKNKLIKNKFLWIEFMYIFVCISLPVLFLINNSTYQIQNIALVSALSILLIMYCFVLVKIIFNNLNLLTTSVFKSIIYFYTIEFIPILLLMKYLKTF